MNISPQNQPPAKYPALAALAAAVAIAAPMAQCTQKPVPPEAQAQALEPGQEEQMSFQGTQKRGPFYRTPQRLGGAMKRTTPPYRRQRPKP